MRIGQPDVRRGLCVTCGIGRQANCPKGKARPQAASLSRASTSAFAASR